MYAGMYKYCLLQYVQCFVYIQEINDLNCIVSGQGVVLKLCSLTLVYVQGGPKNSHYC